MYQIQIYKILILKLLQKPHFKFFTASLTDNQTFI